MLTFDAFMAEVDTWCRTLFSTSWNDLCGDPEPLQRAFDDGETPEEFARRWGDKYDLTSTEDLFGGW